MRGQCIRSMGQKTRRSRAFPPPTRPRSPAILLTAPLSYNAVVLPLSPCETLRRDRKLATSSLIKKEDTHGYTRQSSLVARPGRVFDHLPGALPSPALVQFYGNIFAF